MSQKTVLIQLSESEFETVLFDCIDRAIKLNRLSLCVTPDTDPYGDFNWLLLICPGVPASTLRIKSASGEIPGVVKFGKRVLYEKAAVLEWLRSKTRTRADATEVEQVADAQIRQQLTKKRGIK